MSQRRHHGSTVIALLFLAVGTFVLFLERDPGVKKLTAAQVAQFVARDSTVVLVDVRTPEEWRGESGHLLNAHLIPLGEIPQRISEFDAFRGRPLVLYCRSGARSGRAAKILAEHGIEAISMAGGIRSWHAEGYPVLKEKGQ